MKSIDIKIGSPNEVEQFLEDAKNKKIHLVCFANKQPESYCYRLYNELITATEQKYKFPTLIDKVNKVQDVGCLYPIANMSIIPTYDYNEPQNESKIKHDLKEIIFQANERFMKTDTIVFLLDRNMDIYKTLSNGIYEICGDSKTSLEWLRTIVFC
ncbi:MAG: hypothetical protein ACK4YD_02030 [Chitinophagia bacterium]|jgi:hypothetical protein